MSSRSQPYRVRQIRAWVPEEEFVRKLVALGGTTDDAHDLMSSALVKPHSITGKTLYLWSCRTIVEPMVDRGQLTDVAESNDGAEQGDGADAEQAHGAELGDAAETGIGLAVGDGAEQAEPGIGADADGGADFDSQATTRIMGQGTE